VHEVGQAIGIVMERYGIDGERAFQFLVRASSTSNIKLRVIAEELVQQADESRSTGG
jgi:AmiR/NasT family two-component response regulator